MVRLWDVESRRELGTGLPATPNVDVIGDFSPDGKRLAELSASGQALLWEMTPSAWEAHACSVASDLTRAESREFLERPYEPVCPGQPSAS